MRLWGVGLVCLLAAGATAAQTVTDAAAAPPVVLEADAPVTVWVNGLEVALTVATGSVDHVTLNDNIVQRLGLSAVPPDRKGDLVIGGVVALQGRHGRGLLAHGGRLQKQQLYWFPGLSTLPLAGTIGPFALPHERVRIRWQSDAQDNGNAPPAVSLPLAGNIDRAAYGVSQAGGRMLLIGVDVRLRRPLPLVTAATGADLAELLGGRFVGEPWQEEIVLGVRRPVRRLELDRPLQIGPMLIDAVAVRQGGPRDATARLAPGQVTPFDAEEDPEIMQVRGRVIRRRDVARYIMLSRAQLEAGGCVSLLVDKAARRWSLDCGAPAPAATLPAQLERIGVAEPGALLSEVWARPEQLQLALDAPLPVVIDGRPRRLMLGDAGASGLLLNARLARTVTPPDIERLRDRMAERSRLLLDGLAGGGGPPLDMVRGPNPVQPMEPVPERPVPTEMNLRVAGSQAQLIGSWLLEEKTLPHDGRVSPVALPMPRLRLRLADPPASTTGAALVLPIADRSHDQSLMGVMPFSDGTPLFIGIDAGEAQAEPVVSFTVGQELMRTHGGTWAGETWRQMLAGDRVRRLRLMRLSTPWLVGPFRLDAVRVEQVSNLRRTVDGLSEQLGLQRWPDGTPWPDLRGFAGLERELRLTRTQLQAAGCHELVVDKPARSWTLTCAAR